MEILFGFNGIVVDDFKKIPSASELCAMDKRLLYVGTITDKNGDLVHDSFMHVLKPTEIYTIEEVKPIGENVVILKTERHFLDPNSSVLQYLYDNHDSEIYVGDVCDGSGDTGEVWHDTYKMGLDSNILYVKNEDGSCTVVEPPVDNCLSVPDRYGFRIVLKTPGEPEKHYAFFLGISAFNQWTYLKYHAREDQEVLHSLDPDYKNFLYWNECEEFEKYPKLVKSYPKSYSRVGYLKLDK